MHHVRALRPVEKKCSEYYRLRFNEEKVNAVAENSAKKDRLRKTALVAGTLVYNAKFVVLRHLQ